MKHEKYILFVDDRPESLDIFMDILKDKGHKTEWVETLDQAVTFIKKNKSKISGIIIDLFIKGFSKIDFYQEQYKVTINQGQSLGLHLREKWSDIPYFYFSDYPAAYSRPKSLPEEKEEIIIPKFQDMGDTFEEIRDNFYKICKKYLRFNND
ncbi:putative Response regulator receiver protein [Candidatus Desulfarcum epimagneticum]|uniref:Putative Response regulator receiver protein n=1 Tax=uncultured Desulfobacteraceae bacterium TaxID=218296 RepID=A0A484HLC5_9BACT|nr:putative Response regulator receiver protein [uncultured Desulfobacteraceae bacterium]